MGEEIELTIASGQASSLSTFHLIVRVGSQCVRPAAR